MWMSPGRGGPWAIFSSGDVQAQPNLTYNKGGCPLVEEAHGQSSVVELWPSLT